MTYSCSDFTDDVVNELVRLGVLNAEAIPDDDPEEQAKLVLEAIRKLEAAVDATHTSQSSADIESSSPRQYRVRVTRTGYRSCLTVVMASSPNDAKQKALSQVGDHDFAGEYDADYAADYAEQHENAGQKGDEHALQP